MSSENKNTGKAKTRSNKSRDIFRLFIVLISIALINFIGSFAFDYFLD